MSDAPTEVEAKFEIDDVDRERLATVERVGDFAVVSRRSLDQDDLYFDTDDPVAGLAGAGATLRVRRNQKGAFMTFKGKRVVDPQAERHVAARMEDEVPLNADYDRRVSMDAALPDDATLSPLVRARALVGDAELRPTARLENSRLVIDLEDSAGRRYELALDQCVATRLSDGRVVEFGEVELEAKSTHREALVELSDGLRAIAPSLRPSYHTKLERALT